MPNYSLDSPPSNLIRVVDELGCEKAFSLGVSRYCPNILKVLDADEMQKDFNKEHPNYRSSYIQCQCGLSDWSYYDGTLYLASDFHDHNGCIGRPCKRMDSMNWIRDILKVTLHEPYRHDYAETLYDFICTVMPHETDRNILQHLILHKLKFDVAIDVIKDVEMNWFNCCGLCQHRTIYHPFVKSVEFYGRNVWRFFDCPWDGNIVFKMPYDSNGKKISSTNVGKDQPL